MRAAVRCLARGGIIAFPTETTYGLGCDPRKAASVRRLFRIKGRPEKKPVLLTASSLADVRKVAEISPAVRKVASRYWPGALTLVLPKKNGVRLPPAVAPQGEVAIRVSSSTFVQKLVHAYRFPVIATSANRSGKPPATSARTIVRVFLREADAPDVVVDAGALPRRRPSTIARVHDTGRVEILRQGSVRVKI